MSKRTRVLQKEKDTQKIVHEREEIQRWKYESMTGVGATEHDASLLSTLGLLRRRFLLLGLLRSATLSATSDARALPGAFSRRLLLLFGCLGLCLSLLSGRLFSAVGFRLLFLVGLLFVLLRFGLFLLI